MSDSRICEKFSQLAIEPLPIEAKEIIQKRTTDLVKNRNEGNVHEFVDIFTEHAIFFDADGRLIKGKDEILVYSTVLFEYRTDRGGHPFQLDSKQLLADRSSSAVFYDKGSYTLGPIENGRYVHKWTWEGDNFFLDHAYLTIDNMVPFETEIINAVHNGHRIPN